MSEGIEANPVDAWAVLAALSDGVVALDPDGYIRWCNAAATELLGVDADNLIDEPISELEILASNHALTFERLGGAPPVVVLRRPAAEPHAAFLVRVADELSGSLNLDRTMGRASTLAVPDIADGSFITVLDGNDVRRVGSGLADGEIEQWIERTPAIALPDAVQYVRSIQDAHLIDGNNASELSAAVPAWAPLHGRIAHSAIVVPMRARGSTIGAAVLLAWKRDAFTAADVALAEAFCRRVSAAIDNAMLYRDRSYVAQVLQRSLLPPSLPSMPDIDVGACYRPVTHTSDIGGDFYDAFQINEEEWVVVVGDVVGKGIAAAALTGVVRHTVRAAAMQSTWPTEILESLHTAVRRESDDDFCTIAVAVLTPGTSGLSVTLALGGHARPYVVRVDGQVEEVGTPGSLVGAFDDAVFTDTPFVLEPDESLVLVTGGVTDAGSRGHRYGAGRLERLLASSVDLPAEILAKRIVQEADEYARGSVDDDMAVVVVRAR